MLNDNELQGNISSGKIMGKIQSSNLLGRVINKILGLDFVWDGTRLGVKKEGTDEYSYADLQGPQGIAGTPRRKRRTTEMMGETDLMVIHQKKVLITLHLTTLQKFKILFPTNTIAQLHTL